MHLTFVLCDSISATFFLYNVDGAMHFLYSHRSKCNTNSAEDSSDMN